MSELTTVLSTRLFVAPGASDSSATRVSPRSTLTLTFPVRASPAMVLEGALKEISALKQSEELALTDTFSTASGAEAEMGAEIEYDFRWR